MAGYGEDWTPLITKETAGCEGAWADQQNIIHGASYQDPLEECPGPFSSVDPSDQKALQNRHNTGWSNMFAFPWEVCSYWNCSSR